MDKIKNHNPQKILWFIVMFFIISITAYAQDSSNSSTYSSSPSSQNLSFNDDAKQLSNSLIEQTGLPVTKADQISQILIDYRNDISDAKNKALEKRQSQERNPDVTGSQSRVDMSGILGDNVDQYYIGATSDLMSDYRDADKKADSKIKDTFDDDTQKAKYDQVKSSWWRDVKDKVFTSLTPSPQQPMK